MNKLVLMENDIFIVSDEDGDIREGDQLGAGVYYHDMRHLSVFELRINNVTCNLLNSSAEQNFVGNIHLANPQLPISPELTILPHTLSIRRSRFITSGFHERLVFTNYNNVTIQLKVSLTLRADFKDMFDVRGWARTKRGRLDPPIYEHRSLTLSYLGADSIRRRTAITFDCEPTDVRLDIVDGKHFSIGSRFTLPDETLLVDHTPAYSVGGQVMFDLTLEPHRPASITLHVLPLEGELSAGQATFETSVSSLLRSYDDWVTNECTRINTDNQMFNRLLYRSIVDLRVLSEWLPTGLVPVAGIPWFACPFGRDSIITSLQAMMLNPNFAVGVLRFLARYQSSDYDDWRDAEPGKILHELRFGEMAKTGEVPHTPYYGSLDSTPLFLMLMAETMSWLDDDALFDELWPNVKRALVWVDRHGDLDGDGFLEYLSRSPSGIRNQVWKDSHDSLAYRDGRLVDPPISPVEVQGYAYAAKLGIADVLERRGEHSQAELLRREAEALKRKFNEAFWLEDEGFFAQALDSTKKPVPAISSNPGHCLYSGIIDQSRAKRVADRLLARDLLSGWGIRTLSEQMATFNPMSYHNGSVWPHDNSLIIAGLKRNGFDQAANEVATEIFQAAMRFRYSRLPELYCGFARDPRYESVPANYPVSCSPQAWAAGCPILMTQSMLGISVDAKDRTIYVRPHLPDWLNWVSIEQMRVGTARVDLRFERQGDEVRVTSNAASRKLKLVQSGWHEQSKLAS